MKFKNYYKILELETNKVTIDQIKSAYRKQAKKYHPDVNVGDKLAEEKIKDVNEAYRILSNPSTKRKYDRTWNYNVGRRLNQTIVFKDLENKDKTITIKLPEGVQENEKIRLMGQGKTGKNGGKNGDMFIKINIEDSKKFKLDGINLSTIIPITPWEAVLGTKAKVESIDGTRTQIYIPNGVQSGETIKIPNKGYKNAKGERGNLIGKLEIVIPEKITSEEKEMFKKLKEISKFNPRSV